jgi:type VI secretion system protein ImpF
MPVSAARRCQARPFDDRYSCDERVKLTSSDRFQPALLDRLTDDAPQARGETGAYRAVPRKHLRECVMRDLSSLLNAHALYGCTALSAHPLAEASVINYGLHDVTGKPLSSLDVAALARQIERAIVRFEPRLAARTVRVSPLLAEGLAARTSVAFLVEGDLWGQRDPERLVFRTELDLESGQARIVDELPAASYEETS